MNIVGLALLLIVAIVAYYGFKDMFRSLKQYGETKEALSGQSYSIPVTLSIPVSGV